jgi:murein DD-endopeptidase MepM/ murein hydrolase activator NlpD
MYTKKLKIVFGLSILALIFTNSALIFAADSPTPPPVSVRGIAEPVLEEVIAELEEPEFTEEELELMLKQDEFLDRIEFELDFVKSDYKQLLNSLSDTESVLEKVSEEKMTLQEQLSNLDRQIDSTTSKLLEVVAAILEKEHGITLIEEEIAIREVALEYQKDALEDYISIVYQQESEYFSYDDDGNVDAFKLLLADGNVGENLRELDYFALLNETAQQIVDRLERLQKELLAYENVLSRHKDSLSEMQITLASEKNVLELKQDSKEKLLQITLGQQEIYTQLLDQTLDQQGEMLDDIKSLNDSLKFIALKIEQDGLNFNPDDYEEVLDYKSKAIYNFHIENLGLHPGKFIWPVDPDKGISAYFRDSGYAGTFGVQHNAVDIPEYQGSPVRASANAVVYTAKDNDYGYSYVILAHAGGFQTIYGHMNKILVEEGEFVPQGGILGLSGGMPGTLGAGYMTTGPHLHLEMLLNGTHVDPLNYLPLDALTQDQIDNLPIKYKKAWEKTLLKTVKRIVDEKV